MIAKAFDPVAELQSAFSVLIKNLSLAAIPAIACVIVFAIFALVLVSSGASALVANGLGDPSAWAAVIGAAALGIGIACIASIIVMLIAQAAVIAGSQAVWEGRAPDLGAGVSRALSRALDLFLAGLVIAIIAVAISWTFLGPL